MPDIAMCTGNDCSRRNTCYRATATPYSRQSYFSPEERGDACNYYMIIKPVKEQIESPPCKTEDHHVFDSTGVCTKCGAARRPK